MANILSPILIVRLSDLFCGNGLDPDHVAKEFHEEAVQIGLGPLRMQEENPLHVTGRGGERGSFHNAHPRKVIYLKGYYQLFGCGLMQGPLITDGRNRRSLISWAWTLCRIPLAFQK